MGGSVSNVHQHGGFAACREAPFQDVGIRRRKSTTPYNRPAKAYAAQWKIVHVWELSIRTLKSALFIRAVVVLSPACRAKGTVHACRCQPARQWL